MTITVETGAIVTGANSYDTIANIRAFLTARGYAVSTDDTAVEALIHRTMDQLDGLDYRGYLTDSDQPQPLAWPRTAVVLDSGVEIGANAIPDQIKKAIAFGVHYLGELAVDTEGAPSKRVVREKVDVLEVEYAGNNEYSAYDEALVLADMPLIANCLKPLLNSGTGATGRIYHA